MQSLGVQNKTDELYKLAKKGLINSAGGCVGPIDWSPSSNFDMDDVTVDFN